MMTVQQWQGVGLSAKLECYQRKRGWGFVYSTINQQARKGAVLDAVVGGSGDAKDCGAFIFVVEKG
eukprot:1814075-Ditylum_brightwellii.AAC.1